ncbi:MAG TPA: ABC transporter substrate-binding protein [Kofleriaceae bacterium]
MKRVALVLALAFITDAHGEGRPRYGGSVEATLLGAPASLDPIAARSHAEATVTGLVFDTLYRLGPGGVVLPHVAATAPVLDEKQTTVHIAIRRGIRMHDGSELTAQDVASSLERARTQARWLFAPVLAVKADGDAIVLSLRAPVAELTMLLSLPQLAITKAGKPPGDRPIGSGPYAVDGLDRQRRKLALRAFDDHFAGRPYVDQLALTWYDTPDGEARRFETGKSHISARGAAAFAGGQPTFRTDDVEGPPALLVFVGFGRAHADITNDKAFRRALDLAMSRGGLTTISSGERVVPTRSPVPVEAGGYALTGAGKAADLVAARAQLADAARRVPALAADKLSKLRLEIVVEDTRPDDRQIAERVSLALDKLGIQAVITPLSAPDLRKRVAAGQHDLWIGQHAVPVTAQLVWWTAAFSAGGDDWAASAFSAGTIEPGAAANEFAKRLPIVPLMFRSVRMWHPTNLRGIAFDAVGRPCYENLFLHGAPTPNKGRP